MSLAERGLNIMKRNISLVFVLCVLLSTFAFAEEKMPEKINLCGSCHGSLGISNYDLWPNIAGQKKGYLQRQLKAFQNGDRQDPWMTPIAMMLNDQDIKELADFFSKL